ncbi:MAG: hypothetical protein ACI3XJ_13490 [Oscillospiraceae bacterium]
MRKGRTYAVFASNGTMITRNYSQAVFCRDHYFFSPCMIKKFDIEARAEEAAIDHLWDIAPLDRAIPEHLTMGQVYTGSKLPRNE